MNSDGRIYRELEDSIPKEDKARLDGYLHARAEADELKRLRDEVFERRQEISREEYDRVAGKLA